MFGGIENFAGATAAGTPVGVAPSNDGNGAGASGAAGARLLVLLQAQSRTKPAAVKSRMLTGRMKRVPELRGDRRLWLRTNLVENFANVLVQNAVPRREGRMAITRAGKDRRFWQTNCDLGRSLAVADPRRRPPEPCRQRALMC